MLQSERLVRPLLILGILSALVYLGRFLWEIGQSISDLILLLSMAWLVAYILRPIAYWLNSLSIHPAALQWISRRWGEGWAERLDKVHIPYGLAAVLLYLLLLVSLVLAVILIAPGIIKQLGQLAVQVPRYIEQIPDWWQGIQTEIVHRFDVDPETLSKAIPINRFTDQATSALPNVLGNAITVVQSVVTGIANVLLVLALSLYIMLDEKRLADQFYRVLPIRYEDEMRFVFSTIDRTFGGFLRGQVLMALIQGIFTGIVMRLLGLQYTMITAILSGIFMFIPEIGAPIAMIAPSIAAALQGSATVLPLLLVMLVFQQLLLRFVIPKILSEALGMPPLLILVSVLVSAKIIGLWGFLFGIPVAGAIYIIVLVALERYKAAADAHDKRVQTQGADRGESVAD
jgi:predicted PurR-regulated permease PerM